MWYSMSSSPQSAITHAWNTQQNRLFLKSCLKIAEFFGVKPLALEGASATPASLEDSTVELGDITKAKQIAEKLRNDEEFYLYCSKFSKLMYKERYNEDKFNTTFQKQFKIS